MVLVDTSVWIEYLERVNPSIEETMDTLLRSGEIAIAGLVLAELRQGCRRPSQVRMTFQALEPLSYLEADRATWILAGRLSAEAAARGYHVPIGNCLLAALAFDRDCLIFTLDQDFKRIPGVKLYHTSGAE